MKLCCWGFGIIKKKNSLDKQNFFNAIDPCSICLEDIELNKDMLEFSCGHYTHLFCFSQWFRKKGLHKCIYCQQKIGEYHFQNVMIHRNSFMSFLRKDALIQMGTFKYIHFLFDKETIYFQIKKMKSFTNQLGLFLKKKNISNHIIPICIEDILFGPKKENIFMHLSYVPCFYYLSKYNQKM